MLRKELAAVTAALAVANAAVPAQLVERAGADGACQLFTQYLTQYFTGGYASATGFCSSFLSYSTTTVTSTTTITPASATTTSTSVTTQTTSLVSTATTVTTTTVTPATSTVTSTSYCPVSGYNGPNPTKRAAEPWWWGSSNNNNDCTQYQCTRVDPSGASCGAPGYLTAPALIKVTLDKSLSQCRDSCIGNSQCQSFSYFNSFGPCQLYSKSIKDMKLWQPSGCANSPLQHFDLNCYSCKQQTTSTPYTQATANPNPTGFISAGCSCLGVTSPAPATSTASTTLAARTVTSTVTSTVIKTSYTSTSTTTQTSTSNAPAPQATKKVTIPNASNETYTNQYQDTYAEAYYVDFRGNDLIQGECYKNGKGFELDNGNRIDCKNFNGCEDVCSYINANGGYNGKMCGAVTYHPNNGGEYYSTCYIKTGLPIDNSGYCGEVSGNEETDSGVLIN